MILRSRLLRIVASMLLLASCGCSASPPANAPKQPTKAPSTPSSPPIAPFSKWQLTMAGKQGLMSGALTVHKTGNLLDVDLQPESPPWAKRLSLHARVVVTDTGYVYESRTAFPK